MSVENIINEIIRVEGGYSNDPSDAGGETMYGVTIAVARANGWHGPMKEMPLGFAKEVYRKRYYLEPKFDKVAVLSEKLAEELTDFGVNAGTDLAKKTLQKALNVLNRQTKDYDDVLEDGDIGPKTLGALASYLAKRGNDGELVLLKAINVLQGAHYIRISEGRPANEEFLFGWLKNRVVL